VKQLSAILFGLLLVWRSCCCANISDGGPTGSCVLPLRRQNELLRFAVGFAAYAGGSGQRRPAKTAFDFCPGHRGRSHARKPAGLVYSASRLSLMPDGAPLYARDCAWLI